VSDQTTFAQALFNPGQLPPGLSTWNGSDPAPRFAVYRNNVLVALVDALAATLPVVQQLVGVDFFRAMAHAFALQHPPRSRVMALYGADFPAFVAQFAPAAGLPYLADVARLELCRVRAYHAADVDVLDQNTLQRALGLQEQLHNLMFSLHPSLHAVQSQHAVASLWAAHQGGLDGAKGPNLADVDPSQPESALVFRDGLAVRVLPVSAATAGFIRALQQGQTLQQAAGLDLEHVLGLDLAASLALLIRHPLITGVHHAALDC